jgi:multicomponent Na+:H+ antiporter subunit E
MVQVAILALPVAALWVLVTDRLSLESFAVGYVLGIVVALVLGGRSARLRPRRIPAQMVELLLYSVTMIRDILLSSFDVARRVVDPKLPLASGIIEVDTEEDDTMIAALSAHSITVTPGEMVVDFGGNRRMFVHCLDVNEAAETLQNAQARRAARFRRILGYD